ncbi:MAG TPA: dethiobiotin synthase [Tepidisphaeraceae bacterium]|nr:dethiobiotin synthase [Tepidisphaeraceae bacterium]
MPIHPLSIPGLFVTGTDTDVGKTVIAGAIANWFSRRNVRTAVCKFAATGCVHRREGLVSEDAEFLAVSANSKHPLDLIAPQRWVEPLAPAIAAQRANQPIDWFVIDNSIRLMSQDSDVMIVEGVGGIMVPLDEKNTVLDVAIALKIPTIIVARAGLGTINHTLLTISALRAANVEVAGVVMNRYHAESPDAAEETNPRAIQHWGKTPLLCIVPDEPLIKNGKIPAGIAAAIDTVDWAQLARLR